EPSQPQINGPEGRIVAGSRASFRCSANNFPSKAIKVLWRKDGEMIQPIKTKLYSNEVKRGRVYRVESSVTILLAPGDVRSQLSCQIQHNSSQKAETSPVQLNASVILICNAESFYPEDATIGLFARDAPRRKGMVASKISNPDGTFSYKSFMEVIATQDRNSSMFLCQVQQDSQPLVNETTRLFITRPLKKSE
ncbi:Tyrosine-protein phosphatase non-receptor type substrate 1, partial [Ophiophagus hannah]